MTSVDINESRWITHLDGWACEVGPYRLYVLSGEGFDYTVSVYVGKYGNCLAKVALPNWMTNSLPELGPGLMLDWLAEQGIG